MTDPLGRLLAGVLVLFAVLTALGLHGFSLPFWHRVIDGSPAPEVLLGEPRAIRSDDWKVQIPMALAQRAHAPRFPVVNEDIGLGMNMLAPVGAPVAHPLALFRPTFWGFFLGGDTGVAWLWWSQALGAFAVWAAVLAVLARGRVALAALGAAALVGSPFFQLWSGVGLAPAAYAGLAFLAARALARARRPAELLGAGLALGWAGGCLALVLYPPYQVALAWLVAPLLVATLVAERRELAWREALGFRLAAAALAAAVAVGALAWLLLEARDVFAAMRATAYPGQRVSSGGDRSLAELAVAALGLPLAVERWGPLLNVCESATPWLTFPVVAAGLAHGVRVGRRLDPVAGVLLAACVAVTLYGVVGIPEGLARVTGLGFVPGKRALLALAIADVALLVRFLAVVREEPVERGFAAAAGVAWAGLLVAAGLALGRLVPDLPIGWIVAAAALNGALAFALLAARRPGLALAAFALVSIASAAWFNPLVRGGTAWLVENPLSQRILAIDREAGGETTWAAFGPDELGDLFRAIGVRAVNGLHPVPQLALFEPLARDGRDRDVVNRYAHVGLVAVPRPDPVFKLVSADTWFLRVRPDPERLRALGVTHVLVRTPVRAGFEKLAPLEHLGSVGEHHLYRVPAASEGSGP